MPVVVLGPSQLVYLLVPVLTVVIAVVALVYTGGDLFDTADTSRRRQAEVVCDRATEAFRSIDDVLERDDPNVPEWRDAYETVGTAESQLNENEHTAARRNAKDAFEIADRLAAEAVGDAHAAREADHPGADSDRADDLITLATEAYDEERHTDAWLHAREAMATAAPDFDRLLADAETKAKSGFEAFEAEKYQEAGDRWETCRKTYERALEIAVSRGDDERAAWIEDCIETATQSIETAEREHAHRLLRTYTADAAEKANDASDAYEDGDYRTAAALFEAATEDYASALRFARDWDLDAAEQVETAHQWTSKRVADSRLATVEVELETVESRIDDDPRSAIDEVDAILKWVNDLDLPVDRSGDREALDQEARRVQIRASTAFVRDLAEQAERHHERGRPDEARYLFKTARSKLSDGLALTRKYNLPEERGEIEELIDRCREQITDLPEPPNDEPSESETE